MLDKTSNLGHLLPPTYRRLITSWLEEDCPSFDCGGFVVGESQGEARLLGKSKVRLHSETAVLSLHVLRFNISR